MQAPRAILGGHGRAQGGWGTRGGRASLPQRPPGPKYAVIQAEPPPLGDFPRNPPNGGSGAHIIIRPHPAVVSLGFFSHIRRPQGPLGSGDLLTWQSRACHVSTTPRQVSGLPAPIPPPANVSRPAKRPLPGGPNPDFFISLDPPSPLEGARTHPGPVAPHPPNPPPARLMI